MDPSDLNHRPAFLDEIEKLRHRVSELEGLLASPTAPTPEGIFSGLLDHTPYLVQMLAPDGRLTYVNRAWQELLGFGEEEIPGLFFTDILARDHIPAWKTLFQDLVREETTRPVRFMLRAKSGKLISIEGHFNPVMRGGELIRINGVFRSRDEIRKNEGEREQFFLYSLDLLAIIGFDGYFKRINPAFEGTLGYRAEELFEKPVLRFVHKEDRRALREEMRRLGAGTPTLNFEHRFRCKDGTYKWLAWTGHPMMEEKRVYAVARDTTSKKHLEMELRRLSVTDDLTRLYNRRGFMTFTEKLSVHAVREKKGLLVTLLDIDRMKEINDRYGHGEGDRAIAAVAGMLRKVFRETDVVARLGGDEFAVSAVVAQQGDDEPIRRRLRALLEEFNVKERRAYHLSFSLGCAFLNPEESLQQVLDRADRALYEDKRKNPEAR